MQPCILTIGDALDQFVDGAMMEESSYDIRGDEGQEEGARVKQ